MTRWEAIDQHIQSNLERTLEELARLCAQPSIAAQGLGMEQCAELVAEMLRARGFEAVIMPSE